MRQGLPSIEISDIDHDRFGVKTAKVTEVRPGDLEDIMRFCRRNKVEFLIARCLTIDLKLAQEMESRGFQLMDTLIYYSCNLEKDPPPDTVSGTMIRTFRHGEETIISLISAEAFEGYQGHYHADQRLDKNKCDDVYTDWAYKSCISRSAADEVFVAEYEGKIIGFGTVKMESSGQGHIILAGVLKKYQGLGVYRSIFIHCMKWCLQQGLYSVLTSTQITNLAVQRVWIRLGFEPCSSYYTFHKWFGEVGNYG